MGTYEVLFPTFSHCPCAGLLVTRKKLLHPLGFQSFSEPPALPQHLQISLHLASIFCGHLGLRSTSPEALGPALGILTFEGQVG